MWRKVLPVMITITLIKHKGGVMCEGAKESPLTHDVLDLVVEPSYHSVKLRWSYFNPSYPKRFRVSLCEISEWSFLPQCSERFLSVKEEKPSSNNQDVIISREKGIYETEINGLRMFTNYTLSINPEYDVTLSGSGWKDDSRQNLVLPRSVSITTKGFSARASQCLPNASEVVVNTGPFFGGKIAVEDNNDQRCAVNGNRSSPQHSYALNIVHDICGSKVVNNSRVDTMIVVHENRNIITQNSRRYLVQCNLIPKAFTIRAAVYVPKPHKNGLNIKPVDQDKDIKTPDQYKNMELSDRDIKMNSVDDDASDTRNDIFTYDNYKLNNVRDSRFLAQQSASVDKTVETTDSNAIGQLTLMVILVIAAVVGCAAAMWWVLISKKRGETDMKPAITTGSYIRFSPDNDTLMQEVVQDDVAYSTPVTLKSVKSLPEVYSLN
ncbi:uncharacterized protein LOC143256552 [Tachypleus tridentatus]|uniref:uncharacterized protein LOC143256552 n=1 Tax=Tachypleus tridentatus TaxID=6853 RepID=UPI003FD3D3B6